MTDDDGEAAVWPCVTCGRPVAQPVPGSRTVRYCQDDGGACESAGRERLARDRDSPGLTGQVAWAWEMVERLEQAAGLLAGSLSGELSVAGVERRVAETRAEAAAQVAAAQQDREAVRREAEAAWAEASSARARVTAAEHDAFASRREAEEAAADRDALRAECQDARRALEAESASRLAAESDRDRVAGREQELLSALEAARGELVALHSRLSEAETLVEGQRVEAAAAQRTAEDLREAVRDAESARGRAVADRDQIQARLHECEQQTWTLGRTVEELRAAVTALTAERDAARGEADRARRRVDALTRPSATISDRAVAAEEPPTGLHSLNGVRLPQAG
ncbi:hypothetical protein [Actinomadura parmotrematis]|uniref:Chromosome segregation ATPase n=1 Tax=Actinomadura parmotrematis TaxID=2864039 RepID=A0ABS7G1S5_9ACTN|nr:hypothetical protein [Actinomadura parmotrematis]MBW8485603.1 hypothetical protein [Actinomadura parmotrematis]